MSEDKWDSIDLKPYIDESNRLAKLFSEQSTNYAELMGYKYFYLADGSQGWAKEES